MDVNWSLLSVIITGVITILGLFGFKKITDNLDDISKEISELFAELSIGLADGRLTSEELQKVYEEFKHIIEKINCKS